MAISGGSAQEASPLGNPENLSGMPFNDSMYPIYLVPLGLIPFVVLCRDGLADSGSSGRHWQARSSSGLGSRVPQRATLIFSTIAVRDGTSDPGGMPVPFSSSLRVSTLANL